MLALTAWLAAAAPVQRYAVVIGADHGQAGEEPLRFAEEDAARVARVLTDLGDVRAEDLVLLRGPSATRVEEVLDGLAQRIARDAEADADTVLFVYYSGHADAASLHLGTSELPLGTLKGAVEAVPVDLRVLVVDACQSGELTRLKGVVPAEPFTIEVDDRLDSEGMAIVTSSSPGEDAQESDRLRGGVFSHHLVSGLQGAADQSGDAKVTLSEAFQYARTQTIRSTSRARFVQHPTYDYDLRGEADLVLTRMATDERLGQLVLGDEGTWLVFHARRDGELQAEVNVAEGGQLVLPPGDYLVRRRETASVREAEVHLSAGESVLVQARDMAAVPYGQTVRRGLAEERSAWAVTAGGGVVGPTVPGIAPGPLLAIGARLDLEPLSVGLQVHGARQGSSNASLAMTQHRGGVDLQLVKRVDVGPVAPGIGVRLGGDVLAQSFDSLGEAPARQGIVGRVGPWLGLDLALSQRTALSLSGGADVQLYRALDGTWASLPVPQALLEVVRYVR